MSDAHSGQVLDHYLASPSDGPVPSRGVDLHGNALDLHAFEENGQIYLIDSSYSSSDSSATDPYDLAALYELAVPVGALWTLDARRTDIETIELVVSADNEFADSAAVSAHANMKRVYDYFFTNHGRRGIAGDGSSMVSVVHVTEEGASMGNAFWNGVFIAYGDGNELLEPLAKSLDIAAHEMTHGILDHTVGLEYRFQSGALNESFADIFAVMIDDDDWQVGEDVTNKDYAPSGALRDLRDPHNQDEPNGFGWQPAHFDEYVELTEDVDNGGVHVNSGIPNRAAYLVAEAIGREKTAQIYYRILDASYLTERSQFVDCRFAAERAARDLFGDGSPEVDAVLQAYDAVGITADLAETVEPPKEPLPPGEVAASFGTHWVATVAAEADGDNSLWLVKPTQEFSEGWEYLTQLTTTQVFAESGNTITAPFSGNFLLFVDSDNNLRYIRDDGSDETVIDEEGIWSSIAISPDGSRLAATSVFEDSLIYYFELDKSFEDNRPIKLYHRTTQDGIIQEITRFADALLWDASSTYIIYDAFNSLPGPGDETIDFWTVNALDPISEVGWSIFPPQPAGVQIANPALSNALLPDGTINDCRLLYERLDLRNAHIEVSVLDLCTGQEGVLYTADGQGFTFPGFINQDREIVFGEWTTVDDSSNPQPWLWRLQLADDGLSSLGKPQTFVPNALYPRTIIVASDDVVLSTAVEEEAGLPQPTAFSLTQNYPNPFNAETLISYSVPSASRVILDIFNVSGQRVAAVDQGMRSSGVHAVRWSGVDAVGRPLASGIYFYRLRLPGKARGVEQQTRKMLLLR